jgi:hypothetical protein
MNYFSFTSKICIGKTVSTYINLTTLWVQRLSIIIIILAVLTGLFSSIKSQNLFAFYNVIKRFNDPLILARASV